MNAEIWASIGTLAATFALFSVPALVYTWYALETMIGDKQSYDRVVAVVARSATVTRERR
jgi:hypothetical protein